MPITRDEIETIVRNNEDKIHEIRQNIENFRISVQAGVLEGKLVLGELYDKFKKMEPCLHRYCWEKRVIDLSALTYSLQRLPEEVTKTNAIYIQKEPESITNVPGIERLYTLRKRAIYNLGGELEFIAREGETDIFDIVTCLIMYGIEAKKIKEKFRERKIMEEYKEVDFANNDVKRNQFLAKISNIFNVKFADVIKADKYLDYRLPSLLESIVSHEPEGTVIEFDSEFSRTDASLKAGKWTKRITKELEKYGKRPLSIISSDTHSVVNCLTGFAIENRDKILKLITKDNSFTNLMTNDSSFLYYLVQKLCKKPENSSLLEEKIAYEKELGIKLVRDEFETGVDVHIIDLDKILNKYPDKIDPRIKFDLGKLKNKGLIILNMDYSFGRQGAHNMRGLCETLGRLIESISITGKAGLTCICEGGKRFDLILPTYVVPQIVGGIYNFPTGNSLRKEDFKDLSKGINVHTGGPVLTVPGTAMQSDLLFYYYIARDNILGVEMEAAPYLDAIEKAYKRDQLRKDIMLNVGYWASDVPMNTDETLAEEHIDKGFISSYALILATLNKVLNR